MTEPRLIGIHFFTIVHVVMTVYAYQANFNLVFGYASLTSRYTSLVPRL